MVWFQCEDCGENLKKPKLLIHFKRCSAYKFSCIDCGVVFDQQSVQAHSSCVSEAEKYGPKGLNKGVTCTASKVRNGQLHNGSDVDFSRGLSSFPPWACSLCSVKATSQETLELHGQGKKHQSKAKAAAAKERSKTHGGDTGVSVGLISGASKHDSKGAEIKEVLTTPSLDPTRSSAEKNKRKQEAIGEGGDLISTPSGNLEKKLKRGTYIEDKRLPEDGKDSQDKKRKLVEERQETALEGNGHSPGKKSRKQGKLASGEVNGREEVEIMEPWVSESSGTFGKYKNGQQVNKKEKKGFHKDRIWSPFGNSSLIGNNGQTLGVEVTGEADLKLVAERGSRTGDGKSNADKKTKKAKGLLHVEVSKRSDTSGTVQQEEEEGCKKAQKKEQKEAIVHEVSFREWLGEEDGLHGGTPTHPPHDMCRGRGNLEWPESVEKAKQFGKSLTNSTQEGIAKVVKWKKIIRDVLGKLIQSLNGKLKKKDLKRAVLPLAEKAVESALISVDRKALKAELMRQVTSSPRFLVKGKHLMLAPTV